MEKSSRVDRYNNFHQRVIAETNLLNHDCNLVMMMIGLIIGHHKLNKHLKIIDLADVNLCRFYKEKNENAVYILCQCKALCKLRFQLLRDEKQSADYIKSYLSKLKSHIRKKGLYEFLSILFKLLN